MDGDKMEFLQLALRAGIPLIHVQTDDLLNVEQILSHLAGESVKPLQIPVAIDKLSDCKFPDQGRIFFTSGECKTLIKLYHHCADKEKTIVFVNTEKSVLHFDGQHLVTPKELIVELLKDVSDTPEEFIPAFAGLTLKDIKEMADITMTRDEELTIRGVATTRRNYTNLKGIQQVDTDIGYYLCPSELDKWMNENRKFFKENQHKVLMPKGLLLDGPPGTGKTLASKYIARELGVPLYRLDLSAMMGKYVGQSEDSLNAALAQIDAVAPNVVLLDEIEKVFQNQSDSGVTARLLSQLLWWLNEGTGQTIVIMTTNDVTKIPRELYREGRIDKVMEFNGIDNVQDAQGFAISVAYQTALEVGLEIDTAATKRLSAKVKMLFQDEEAVPQSRLSQEAFNLVREVSTGE